MIEDQRTRRLRRTLDVMHLLRLDRVLGRWTRGCGAVFTLHHVRPSGPAAFQPNALLEIDPSFLEQVILLLQERGIDVVSLDEAVARLEAGDAPPFASFTFDDGYRDVRDHALPVLTRHGVPSAHFICTRFADGGGDLWWLRLEHAIGIADTLRFDFGRGEERVPSASPAEKQAAWDRIYWVLRSLGEPEMRRRIDALEAQSELPARNFAAELCLSWDELRALRADPLVCFGNHTVRHYRLAKLNAADAQAEISDAQQRITGELGSAPRHIAYPVGDPTSAGLREFATARELGFLGGWTTRLGTLFPDHRDHLTALPRISLNGHYQQQRYAEMFLSGAPFALRNRFRRLDVA
jgi:peptidoglycan/xylan/chitin deacetylase (PgdA/CDA1 family)